MFIKKTKKKKQKNPNTEPLYQNGKTKPKPQYSPIVVVAVAHPSLSSTHRSSPLIADRSAQIRTSGAQLAASPLTVTVEVSGAQLKVFLISLSFSLSISLSLSHWSLKVWKKNNECPSLSLFGLYLINSVTLSLSLSDWLAEGRNQCFIYILLFPFFFFFFFCLFELGYSICLIRWCCVGQCVFTVLVWY